MQRSVRLCGSAVRRGRTAICDMMEPSAPSGERLWSSGMTMSSSSTPECIQDGGIHSSWHTEASTSRFGCYQISQCNPSMQLLRNYPISCQVVGYGPVWKSCVPTSPALRGFHSASSSRWHGPLLMKHTNEDEEVVALKEGGGDKEEEEEEGEGSDEFDGEEWSEEEMLALKRLEAAEMASGAVGESVGDVAGLAPEQKGEDEGVPDALSGLQSQLQGLPKRVQRFVVRKMMKVKPVEPPSMHHMKKQFQMRIIDVNRTAKVTKGGKVLSFNALVVCGNGDGTVGFGTGKSAEMGLAVDKAYLKALSNLHYFDRYQGRTIAEPQVAKYGNTKVYMWPAKKGQGMSAGPTVAGILRLAGFSAVKSKVIGSRHPHNTVKATFEALSSITERSMAAQQAQ